MVTVVTRAGKGSALTHGEMDANINNLNIGKFASVPATTSGTNTVTVSDDPTEGAYETNHVYEYQIGGTNTGAVTLAIDGLAATAVQTIAGSALEAGALTDGMVAQFLYNGTNFRLLNPHSFTPTNHGTGGLFYPYNGSTIQTVFDVDAALDGSLTYESFGPTGSGATNVWTPMDQITIEGTAIVLGFFISYVGTGANSAVSVRARPGDTTWNGAGNEVAKLGYDDISANTDYVTEATVGLDPSDLTFDLGVNEASATSVDIQMWYKGFYG